MIFIPQKKGNMKYTYIPLEGKRERKSMSHAGNQKMVKRKEKKE